MGERLPSRASTSCGTNGQCDGVGGCLDYPAGTSCGTGMSCDGAGSCASTADAATDVADAPETVDASDTAGAPDAADAAATEASSEVGGDAASDAPFTPVDPSAKPSVGSGLAQSCKADTDCRSGHCVDGLCCDRACTGACEYCALPTSPGTCSLVPVGIDPKRACSPTPCVWTCDGAGACIGAFVGAECSIPKCTGPATGEGPTVCSAVGAGCPSPQLFDCTPYACDGPVGACFDNCHSSADCAPGYTCDVNSNHCVAAPTTGSGGCALATRGGANGRSGVAWASLALGFAVVAARRKAASRAQ